MHLSIEITNETTVKIESSLIDKIESAIEKVLSSENLLNDAEVSVLIVNDETIKSLNAQYRGKNEPTDVLSFPQYDFMSEHILDDAYLYLGDVVISIDTAIAQAESFGHSLEREVIYLTVHSIFHLLGYDHIEANDKAEMRLKEKSVLKELGIFKSESSKQLGDNL